MTRIVAGRPDGSGRRIAIVASRYNEFICDRLLAGALDCLERHGVAGKDIVVARVPGALEIPVTARRLALSRRHDAVVCLGCVIRGDTSHYDQVCSEVARGIGAAALETGVPITFGLVTTETLDQAIDRSGGRAGNRGDDAARAALEVAALFEALDKES
jgi:6,7-dimethyl-8-ribityllumazine synthase